MWHAVRLTGHLPHRRVLRMPVLILVCNMDLSLRSTGWVMSVLLRACTVLQVCRMPVSASRNTSSGGAEARSVSLLACPVPKVSRLTVSASRYTSSGGTEAGDAACTHPIRCVCFSCLVLVRLRRRGGVLCRDVWNRARLEVLGLRCASRHMPSSRVVSCRRRREHVCATPVLS